MLTDKQQIANAKLSIVSRLNLLSKFDYDGPHKQLWCKEISNCVGRIIVIERIPSRH